MLFVFDTNTLVSGILKPGSVPHKTTELAIEIGTIVFSRETKSELLEVTVRDKFDRYLEKEMRMSAVQRILDTEEIKSIEPDACVSCRDSKDVKFLNLAISVHAKCIVTGDRDLLDLRTFRGIPILSASEFLELHR